jgi:hypothetical protein
MYQREADCVSYQAANFERNAVNTAADMGKEQELHLANLVCTFNTYTK